MSIFDEVGGDPTLQRVHKTFYDKVFDHEWMSLYFQDVDRDFIEFQQTEFMRGVLGGENKYCGRPPKAAHVHIFVTPELFDIRSELLRQALIDEGIREDLREAWLDRDRAFAASVIKRSPDECTPRYASEDILNFADPRLVGTR